jgi:hypothetical protein
MSLSPGSTVIDQEKLRQLMAGGPNVPMIAPPLGGALASPQLPALNFKQRQALPTVSEGTPAGSSAFYGNKIARIEDQEANPRGSADNHSGWPGKIEHVLSKIGNIAGDVADPAAMARIPGTDLNRQAQEKQLGAQQELAAQRETQAKQQSATEAYQTGELADRAKGRQLESDKQNFEENKPGTTQEEAVRDLTQRNNPATGQPYTPEEAAVKYAQDIQDTKPDKDAPLKTVTMLDAPGGKPYIYEYNKGQNYSGDEGHGEFKKIGPAQPNAAAIGMVGTMQPLLGQNGELTGFYNSKDPRKNMTADQAGLGAAGGGTTSSGARLGNTERNQFATQYVKPATDIEQNYQKFLGARKEYDANPATGAASMAATAQHLGSTFGSIKGAQMGEHMIQQHVDAIGLFDRLGRYADQLQSGQQLSKSQWDDFQKLITNTRDIQWETTAREAVRRGQPVDFLPPDVHIQLSDSAGHTRYVRGDQVQQYLAQGAKIQ